MVKNWKKLKQFWVLPCLCLSVFLAACQGGSGAVGADSRTEAEQSSQSQEETGQSQEETGQSQAGTGQSQAETDQNQTQTAQSLPAAKEGSEKANAIPGSYTVPDGWTEAAEYSTKKKIFYVKAGHEKDKHPDNIAINVGKNRYSLDQQEEFREAIVRQLLAQLKGSDSMLKGDGTYTKQGYPLYIFQIEDTDSVTRQYYIVDDYRFCLIHLTNYTGSEDDNEAAQTMVDSFVWD